MAQGRRVDRVASLIRREVSDLLRSGFGEDDALQGMVSVTDVQVAGDLQHCKVFVSVFGTEEERQSTMAALKAATPRLRGQLGRRIQMRRTPELVFQLDRGLERGTSVLGLLQRLEKERQQRGGEGADEG
jgi:ribosome-binding factor A